MEFRRFLVNRLTVFFMLSTLITVAVSLIGSRFDSGALFGYDVLLTPVKYAGLCILPTFVTWSGRELSVKELLIRKAWMLVLLEAVIMFVAFTSPVIDTEDPAVVLTIMGSVLAIFVLVNVFLWIKDSVEAIRMNQDLAQYQMLRK